MKIYQHSLILVFKYSSEYLKTKGLSARALYIYFYLVSTRLTNFCPDNNFFHKLFTSLNVFKSTFVLLKLPFSEQMLHLCAFLAELALKNPPN